MAWSKQQRAEYDRRRGCHTVVGVDRLQYRAFRLYFEIARKSGRSCEYAFVLAVQHTRDERMERVLRDKAELVDRWLSGGFGKSDCRKELTVSDRYGEVNRVRSGGR